MWGTAITPARVPDFEISIDCTTPALPPHSSHHPPLRAYPTSIHPLAYPKRVRHHAYCFHAADLRLHSYLVPWLSWLNLWANDVSLLYPRPFGYLLTSYDLHIDTCKGDGIIFPLPKLICSLPLEASFDISSAAVVNSSQYRNRILETASSSSSRGPYRLSCTSFLVSLNRSFAMSSHRHNLQLHIQPIPLFLYVNFRVWNRRPCSRIYQNLYLGG